MEGAVPMAGLTLIGLYCLVRAVLAWPSNLLASLTPVGLVVVGCVVFLVWVCFFAGSGGATRVHRDHPNGWSWWSTKRHEEGHAKVGRAFGWVMRVVLDDGKGNAYTTPVSGPPLTPVQWAAIAMGGEAAAGPDGCGTDRRIAEEHIRKLPWVERARARAEAWKLARRLAR